MIVRGPSAACRSWVSSSSMQALTRWSELTQGQGYRSSALHTGPFTPSDLFVSFLIVIQTMSRGKGLMILGNAAAARIHDYGEGAGSQGLASSSRQDCGSKDNGAFYMMTSSHTHQSCNCLNGILTPSSHGNSCIGTLVSSLPSTTWSLGCDSRTRNSSLRCTGRYVACDGSLASCERTHIFHGSVLCYRR